jgi:hypothetical protein
MHRVTKSPVILPPKFLFYYTDITMPISCLDFFFSKNLIFFFFFFLHTKNLTYPLMFRYFCDHILKVLKVAMSSCHILKMNNDSCTSLLQQMYNTPSHGVGPTHCGAHPMWRGVVHLLYTWCTWITSF